MYNPLLGTQMATGWPQQTQQNHRPSHKSSQKFPRQGGNRNTGVTPQTPSNPGKSPFGMSTLETQLIDIINGQAQGEGSQNGEDTDRYSRKVFVGGLPVKSRIFLCFQDLLKPDIDEDEIQASFRKYGPLVVDWPHKNESRSYFPPKVYNF
jgi:RNA recognition motif-containing protein